MIRYANSFQNGINFYSNKIPNLRTKVFYDEKLIMHSSVDIDLSQNNLISIKKLKKECTFLSIVLIIASVLSNNLYFMSGAMWFTVFGLPYIIVLVQTFFEVRKENEQGLSAAKFHAAEHMAINAFNKVKRVPTLEELKRETRFSKNCGSLSIIRKAIFGIIFFLFMIILGVLAECAVSGMFVVSCIATVVIIGVVYVIFKTDICMYAEVLVIAKPTNLELELAQIAIINYITMETMCDIICQD